ncbi:MAG: alanyl-tRNA editing protein [Lachnospiraceae bacterium]|jgi:alanyl-tRNA synthetase|nr:alanyl-tRNA editing protein [Lachnospiraceae bacterium]
MTEKLYYQDSHQKEFTARVLACEWDEKRKFYGIVLDRTCFFPEGGGQYADSGVIQEIPVEDVQEQEGSIIHYTKKMLTEGIEVTGCINFEERFSKMQQHTGEHILSGLIYHHFGYDNVGFHLGKELVTMDFNGSFTREQLQMIERKANEAVVANIAVYVNYPSQEELAQMDYRSKKELSGQVRIVTVPGYDVCACCAPHVKYTGEIGLIRLIDAARHKGGTRVTMVCGFRALADYQMKEDNIMEISHLLSAKPYETAEAVKRLQREIQQGKDKLFRIQNRYLEQKLEEQSYLLFEEDLDKNAARRFVDTGMHRYAGICGIFLGNDHQGYQYILGSQHKNLRDFLKDFHEKFPGKGGGKPEMVQGTVTASRQEVMDYFSVNGSLYEF